MASHLNVECDISDFHKLICAATHFNAPHKEKRSFMYWPFKHFSNDAFVEDLSRAPLQVSTIFDNIDDQVWFHNALLFDVMDEHAPLKKTRQNYIIYREHAEIQREIINKRPSQAESEMVTNHHYKSNPETFFQRSHLRLRGHSLKLKKNHSSTDTRKYFFSNRVIDPWNAVPEATVTAPSLDSFEGHLRSLP